MITAEIKQELKENWDCEVISESPLIIKGIDDEEILYGLIAELFIKDIIDDIEDRGLDFDKLESMNDLDMLLIQGDFNYADEFNLAEWTTMSVGDFKNLVKKLENYDGEIESYFGTNEELTFDDGNDLLGHLSFKEITHEESDVLIKLFGGSFDGGSGMFEYIWSLDDEDDEDDEDDSIFDENDEDDEDDELDSIFDKNDLKKIELLKTFGWEVCVHNEDDYLLSLTSPQGEVSIVSFYMLEKLKCHLVK